MPRLTDKKWITITNASQKILDKSSQKWIWVDKGSKFYNKSMKSWLEKIDIEMHSAHNGEKSVIAERFIRVLKLKIYKYITSMSKNLYIDKLDSLINKYKKTYHSTTSN